MLSRLVIGYRCSNHLGQLAKVGKAGKPISDSLLAPKAMADESAARVVVFAI